MPEEFKLKVKEVIQRAHNVKSIRLEEARAVEYKPGQFLCAKLNTEDECKRYLSLSSSPTEKGYIEFTKKITQSDFSHAINSIKPGDWLKIEYPFGTFTLKGDEDKIAFISGGIGITPIRSICKYAIDKKLNVKIVLVYANRSIREIIFREDFDLMQRQSPEFKVAHVLCEPAEGFKCRVGLINSAIIKNEVPDFKERKFYLCGPPAMVGAMKRILLEELMVLKDRIITENFLGY